jgi:hypothetical protein
MAVSDRRLRCRSGKENAPSQSPLVSATLFRGDAEERLAFFWIAMAGVELFPLVELLA